MSDTVHRFLLVEPADMDRFEGWLEDMAHRGLHYRHSGVFFVHFRRGEPSSVRYRLEPMGSLWSRESQDYCRALGRDRLGQVGRDFELYRNPDPDAPELHTDPVVRACGLERVSKTLRFMSPAWTWSGAASPSPFWPPPCWTSWCTATRNITAFRMSISYQSSRSPASTGRYWQPATAGPARSSSSRRET